MKRFGWWLAPVLVAWVPVARQLAGNADQVALTAALPVFGLLLAAALLLAAVLRGIAGDGAKGGLALCVGWVLFFSHGWAFERLWDGRSLESVPRINFGLMGGELLLVALAVVVLRRLQRDLEPVLRWVTLTAGFLLVASLGSYVWRGSPVQPEVAHPPSAIHPTEPSSALRPDVYHLVLDGYARSDVLRDVYGFDNREFLDALAARGFRILPETYSNYSTTFLSLSATLNHRYHEPVNGSLPGGRRHYYRLIQEADVLTAFRSLGYKVHWVGTTWSGTEDSPLADEVHRLAPLPFHNEFAAVFWRRTPLRQFEPTVAHSHLFAFETLEALSGRPEPTYTFAHVLAPHNPYVFDADGTIIANVPQVLQFNRRIFQAEQRWSNQDAYIAQLRYINRRVLEMLDVLLARPGPRPVVILQSDHGSAFRVGRTPNDVEVAQERHGVLNAVLAPPQWQAAFPERGTLINTYPILLHHGFGRAVDPLESRVFYSWYGSPYQPKDLTAAFGFAPSDG